MRLCDRRVKIVATIGPSLKGKERLKKAIYCGMNVARLNMSHGSHEEHQQVIKDIRELSKELNAPVSILLDLQGPKIRVGKFKNGSMELKKGEQVIITTEHMMGDEGVIPTDFVHLPQVCKNDMKILLDDGLIELKVISVSQKSVACEVKFGGVLKDRKGMNLPGVSLPIESLTDKDLVDLEFGIKNKVDYIALSFVRSAEDSVKLKKIIDEKIKSIKVVSKIEMSQAINHLKEIILVSDAVMVARGDLAVEVGHSLLPGFQKQIIKMCNEFGKPVITATQMLDSMVENPKPTRAEVTDIANAVLDGTDAVMLSAESASGKFPFECISTMHEVISEVERLRPYYTITLDEGHLEVAEAIGVSVCITALKTDAKAIVCLTTTGKTATYIARHRPKAKIIAMTYESDILNGLELVWGLQTLLIKPYRTSEEAVDEIETTLLRNGLVKKGDVIIVTMGRPVSKKAKTNSLRVLIVEREEIHKVDQLELPLRCRDHELIQK